MEKTADSLSRAAAAKIRSAVEGHILSTGCGFLVCDASWTIVWANARAHQLLDLAADKQATFPRWRPAGLQSLPISRLPHGLIELEYGTKPNLVVFAICSQQDGMYVLQLTEAPQLADMSYQQLIWKNAIESAGHGVWDYNSKNEVMFVSDTWKRMRGIPTVGPFRDTYENWVSRLHPEDSAATIEHVRRHNSGEVKEFSFEYRERHAEGHYVWIHCSGRVTDFGSDGKAVRVIGTDIDITRLKFEEQERRRQIDDLHNQHIAELQQAYSRTEAARQIAHQLSRQDPLTQLPNRRVFSEEIAKSVSDDAARKPFVAMIVDLDRFKPVNDLYGHVTGDAIISEAAARLLTAAGPNALVARLGGDEFGVLLRNVEADGVSDARACAENLIKAIEKPIKIGDLQIYVGASVGIALYPEDGRDQKTLFRNADMALYAVKQSRKGSYIFYSQAMGKVAEVKATMDAAVRRAVADDQFEPYFQPIISLADNSISGFEVLARWQHPLLGFVPPDQFIGILEQSQLMPQFTMNMLRKATLAAKSWPQQITLSVNLSAREVCNLATPIQLFRLLARTGFPISRLKIEITEQALMKDVFIAKQVVAALQRAGAKVSLDDFGAGYAGLGYLRELKFDSIKIDRSFIATMLQQVESRKIVEAMQSLATDLGLETVAEGIENADVLAAVRAVGCNLAQGYHFSRPVPASGVAALFAASPVERKRA